MSSDCGVVRDAEGLAIAAETLGDLARLADDLPARSIASYEVIDLLRVSRAIVPPQQLSPGGAVIRIEVVEGCTLVMLQTGQF